MKKIPTLFERVFEGHKIIGINPKITEGCENAFLHGVATVKIDGSCCAIIHGDFYKRYDAKGKNVPEGAIPCQEEPDVITGHFPCWVKCDRSNKADKWFWKAYDFAPEHNDGTYEAIGKHFQGNPYNMEYDVIVPHGRQVIEIERTFEAVKEWISSNNEEGIVFWLDNKPVCKIKRTDFGLQWNR